MKPNFALNLTDDRISLLHRKEQGWSSLGTAIFGADDMDAQLAAALEAANGMGQRGAVSTKIVIPNSQILYTTLEIAPGPDAARQDDIRAALTGRTPYAVEDLVFDFAGDGHVVQVAVVAQETLDQAEDFAVQYQFRPVAFVAIPPEGGFPGEPFFGLTKSAATVLGKGRRVQRDAEAITVLADMVAPEAEAVAENGPEMSAFPESAFPEAEVEAGAVVDPIVAAEAEAVAVPPVQAGDAAIVEQADERTLPPQPLAEPDVTPVAEAKVEAVAEPEPEPVPAKPDFSGVTDPRVQDVDEAPFADVSDTDATTASDEDLPPAPSTAALMAFASRRAVEAGTAAEPSGKSPVRNPAETTLPGPIAERAPPRTTGNMRPEPRVTFGSTVTAPPASGPKKQRKAFVGGAAAPTAAKGAALPEVPRKPLTKPGGTFASAAPVRGKPRFLGLILTGILVLFLALLAAWSSFFLASSTDPGLDAPTAIVAAEPDSPEVLDEAFADGQDPEAIVLDDPETVSPTAVPEQEIAAGPEPADPPSTTAPEIAAAEAAGPAPETGVVTTGATPVLPDAEADEIRLSTADAPLALQEAASLSAPALQGDALPAPQMAPPPFGTVYAFNANGTIRAVPEGIMTPDGVRLVAGQPANVPPARPAAIIAAALAAATPEAVLPEAVPPETAPTPAPDAPTVVGSDPALADARPRARPATLVVPSAEDDASLQATAPVLASSPRPLARPASIAGTVPNAAPARASDAASLAAASAAAGTAADAIIQDLAAAEPAALTPSGSRLAVSVSRIPSPRPRDAERAVAAALQAATRAPEPEPEPEPVAAATPEAEAEPELEAPVAAAPTSGSVADQATFVNALNLSRINLIGVYGTQSNRYALVRQANGRYSRIEVGDRIDGGVVAAITGNEVRYQKGGRLLALQMPEG